MSTMACHQPKHGARSQMRRYLSQLTICVLAVGFSACAGSQQSTPESSERALSSGDAERSEESGSEAVDESAVEDEEAAAAQAEDQAATEAAREAATAERERAEFEAAIRLVRSGDFESAEREMQRFASHDEFGPWATYNLAVIAFQQGNADEARSQLRRALELDPGHGPATTALVRDLLRRGDQGAARELVEEQLRASDDASGIRAAQLFLALDRGDYEQVIADARSVFFDEPGNLDAHYALAMAHAELGRTQLANYVLRQGLRRDGNRADFYYALGHLALGEGNDQLARTYLGRALTLQPRFPEANLDMGYLHMQTQAYDEAAEAFENATELVPNWAEAWLSLGNAYKGLQRYEDAHAAFERAADLDSEYAAPYYNLGILYLDVQGFRELELMDRLEQAVSYFEEYKSMKGASLSDDDPVHEYEEYARNEIQIQIDLANPPEEDDGWDDEGGDDDWGDDSGDEGSSEDGWDDEGGDDDDWGDDW